MRNILILSLLCMPLFVFAQFPANPGKIRLGIQTTGQGLVPVVDTIPGWTPSSVNNAWLAQDTASNIIWYWDNTGAQWAQITAASEQDTVYLITSVPDTTAITPNQGDAFINSTKDTLGLYDGAWRLFFGGSGGGTITAPDYIRDTVTVSTSGGIGKPVYLSQTDSAWRLADRDVDSTLAHAIIVDSLSTTSFVIQSVGLATITGHGYQSGKNYSLSSTAGEAVLSTSLTTGYDQWLWVVRDSNTLDLRVSNLVVDLDAPSGGADTLYLAADTGTAGTLTTGDTIAIEGAGIATTSVSGKTVTVTATEVQTLGSDLGDKEIWITGQGIPSDTVSLDDWFLNFVTTDATLTGDGSVVTPLGVDTTEIATQYDLSQATDSTRLTQDTILVYYAGGVEIGRDTIRAGNSGGVSGSGSVNYIPKFTPDGMTMGNSLIRENSDSLIVTRTTNNNQGILLRYNSSVGPSIEALGFNNLSFFSGSVRTFDVTSSAINFRNNGIFASTNPTLTFQNTSVGNEYYQIRLPTLGRLEFLSYNGGYQTMFSIAKAPEGLAQFSGTAGLKIHNGTTAQQPTGANGVLRYNTTTAAFEGYSNAAYRAFYQESTADPTTILGKVADGLAGEITVGERLDLSAGVIEVDQRWAHMRKAGAEVYAFSTTPEQIDTLDGTVAGGLFSNSGTGVLTYSNTANRAFQISWQVTFSSSEAGKEVSFEVYEAGAASIYNKATQYAATADKKYSVSGVYSHTANNTDTFDIRGYIDAGTANVTIHNISIVFTEM